MTLSPRAGLLLILSLATLFAGCSSGSGGDDSQNGNSASSSSSSSASSSGSSSSTSSGSSSSSASSSGSGSSSGSSGSSSGGNALSDEFSGADVDLLANNTSDWQVLHPEKADTIDIGITVDGALTVLAQSTQPAAINAAWFEDNYGTLVYKEVTGNFAVMISLRVIDRDTPTVTDNTDTAGYRPDGDYNAGGFVIRDPAGSHNHDENWVMYNMGGQGVGYAREMKKTQDSLSNMFLTLQTTVDEFLLACRVGDLFYFYHWDQIDNQWQQETYYNGVEVHGTQVTTTVPNGMGVITEFSAPSMGNSTPMYFDLDLPDTVQVGIMGHAWGSPYDTRAEFDYVRFSATPPATTGECVTSFPAPM